MSRTPHTSDTAIVRLYEREVSGYIRFYLHYSLNGRRIRELLSDLPRISRSDPHYDDFRQRAEAYRYERTESIRRGSLGRSAVSDLLVSDWCAIVAERAVQRSRPDLHRHTWASIILYTARIFEEFRPHLTLSQLTPDTIRLFSAYLQRYVGRNGKTIATTTAAKRLGAFSYALQCAVREGLLPSNPFSALERGERLHPRQVERDYLTAEELQRLADTPCDEAVRSAYLFMCRCGLRISDVERLRWCDLTESDGRMWLSITVKKTQKPLSLPLSHTACAVLPPRNGKSANEPIFDLPAEQTMNKRLKDWARAAGVNKKLSLHTARHTFATLLLTQGADVYTVSKLLGHSSVQTTQIYARIVDKKKEQAVDLLDKL